MRDERTARTLDVVDRFTDEERAGFQATYSHFKPFDITLDAGYTFKREFDFFRAEASAKLDPAPYVRLAIEAKF